MEKLNDKELINLVVDRNSQAFKILYHRYEIRIFNFILRYTGNREIAQDILQETFTRVWFAAHTFDRKKGNFKGWIYKIALNNTRNEMSKKRYDYFQAYFFGFFSPRGYISMPSSAMSRARACGRF